MHRAKLMVPLAKRKAKEQLELEYKRWDCFISFIIRCDLNCSAGWVGLYWVVSLDISQLNWSETDATWMHTVILCISFLIYFLVFFFYWFQYNLSKHTFQIIKKMPRVCSSKCYLSSFLFDRLREKKVSTLLFTFNTKIG